MMRQLALTHAVRALFLVMVSGVFVNRLQKDVVKCCVEVVMERLSMAVCSLRKIDFVQSV